ncbi:MAG: hypothetical protein K6F83_05845, partial [Clostridiales bacterium]|nr:hypothetical protein [Clostridiales bacterium]
MKEIILPINEEDCLKSYTHNAFISSILLSDEVGGDVAARYKILTDTRERQVIDGNCQTEIGPEVTVRADHYKINGYSAVYWDCKKDDRLIIHVLSRRRISSWERISLIVDDKISPDTFKPAKCLARFGCPSNQNLFVKRREEFLAHEDLKRILPVSYYLKLEKTDLKLNYSYSLDGKKWHEVYLDTLPDKYALSPLSIGILVETRNNYMNWFAANYIQMGLTPVVGGSRMADYCFGLIKNYRPYFTNQFMDFYIEYMDPDDYSCRK